MFKIDLKSLVLGLAFGVLCVGSVTLASEDPELEEVQCVYYNDSKVFFNENEIPLEHKLIEAVSPDGTEAILYMPLDEIMTYMNFDVEWNEDVDTVILSMGGYNQKTSEHENEVLDLTISELESNAIKLIQRTGNWDYIEPYLDDLSEDVIREIVRIYNSKHQNVSEHKKASDYIK